MFGYIIEEENRIQTFLELEYALAGTYSLVSHLKEISLYEDEIAIYQLIRNQVRKYKTPPNRKTEDERNKAIRNLLDRSISSSEVKDIFAMVGIPTPDVSIITDDFLRDFQKDKKHEDLRLKLLEKILYDVIYVRLGVKTNRGKSFKDLLEATLKRYHAREISLSELIARIKETRDKLNRDEKTRNELGLTPEELSFYEAITYQAEKSFDNQFLADILKEVVRVVKAKLKPDWTEDYKEQVRAGVENAVKLVLRKKGLQEEQFLFLYPRIIEHAKVLYHDYPLTGTDG
jgi:type I restriction enzyme R subunit